MPASPLSSLLRESFARAPSKRCRRVRADLIHSKLSRENERSHPPSTSPDSVVAKMMETLVQDLRDAAMEGESWLWFVAGLAVVVALALLRSLRATLYKAQLWARAAQFIVLSKDKKFKMPEDCSGDLAKLASSSKPGSLPAGVERRRLFLCVARRLSDLDPRPSTLDPTWCWMRQSGQGRATDTLARTSNHTPPQRATMPASATASRRGTTRSTRAMSARSLSSSSVSYPT